LSFLLCVRRGDEGEQQQNRQGRVRDCFHGSQNLWFILAAKSTKDTGFVFVAISSCARAGKVVRENLLVRLSALGHYVRTFLAKAESVAKATTAKYKLRSGARNVEA